MNIKTKRIVIETAYDGSKPVVRMSVTAEVNGSVEVMTEAAIQQAKEFNATPIPKRVSFGAEQQVYLPKEIEESAKALMKMVQHEVDSVE